eukprot:12312370-Alexandrium_andersonii.AAC.1
MSDWERTTLDTPDLDSISEILRHAASIDAATYESCFIDRSELHNVYMRSNLGGFSTVGPRGANNHIKKNRSQTILDVQVTIV